MVEKRGGANANNKINLKKQREMERSTCIWNDDEEEIRVSDDSKDIFNDGHILAENKTKRNERLINIITIENYEDAVFNIAKDLNKNYPSFMEDLGVEHKEVDKDKVLHTISKYSDLRIGDNDTLMMVNSNKESISYQELERIIYCMVYHQICNLNM